MNAPASTYSSAEFVETWKRVKETSAGLEGPSLADRLALAELEEPGTVERLFAEAAPGGIGAHGAVLLAFDWRFWGRPKQLAPLELSRIGRVWRILVIIAGRGEGKTRTAAEWVVDRLLSGARDVVLVGPSFDDVKQFMVGGHKKRIHGANGSGLLDVMPPWIRYHYKEDEGLIEFPDLHATVRLHSAEVPEYRGPEPDSVWGDEIIKWRYAARLLSNLRLACRAVGKLEPQILLTTSPKRLRVLRDLVMDPDVVTIHGRTEENRGNVHEGWFQAEQRRLKGTRQGAEELEGELGADDGSEMFPLSVIDAYRVDQAPRLDLVLVAIDPAASKHRKSDETGIVCLGREGDVNTGQGYVLGDKTAKYTPEEWGDESFDLLEAHGGSAFVVERNNIGDTAAANLRATGARRTSNYERARRGLPPVSGGDADGWKPVERKKAGKVVGVDLVKPDGRRIQIREVLAMGDKPTRAAPVSTLYQAGRIHHVGRLERLETEQSEWDPGTGVSPNGLDALVHGAVELFQLFEAPKPDASAAFKGYGAAVSGMRRQEAAHPTGSTVDLLSSLMRRYQGDHV